MTPTYVSWFQMKQRCQNPKSEQYPRYGGRGVKVCERWQSFADFESDMGPRPEGTTLDRYPDRNGNYEPGNCRWATRVEQSHNTHRTERSQRMAAWLGVDTTQAARYVYRAKANLKGAAYPINPVTELMVLWFLQEQQ